MAERSAVPPSATARQSPTGPSSTGPSPDEGVVAEQATADAAGTELPTHVPRSVRSLLWQARIGMGLAVLFGVLSVVLFLQANGLRGDAAARAEVLAAGRGIAVQITTYDGTAIDAWVAETQELSTPAFAEEVNSLFDIELRDGLAANQVVSAGAVTSSFVQEVDGDSATVFAVLRQTYSSINLPREVSDELRMEIELERVGERWLAAEVVALGPSTISPVAGTTEPAPAGSEE